MRPEPYSLPHPPPGRRRRRAAPGSGNSGLSGLSALAGVAAPAFDPLSGSPTLWLEADRGTFQDAALTTPAAANADPVGGWQDQSGSGFSPTQVTAGTRPLLLSNSGFKGKPGVQYSATQNLTGASMPLTNTRTKGTLVCAFRMDSVASGAVFSTDQDQLAVANAGGADFLAYLNSAAAQYASFRMHSTAGGQIVSLVYDGTQTGNAGRFKVWRNMIDAGLTFTGTIAATTFAGGQNLYLGRLAAGSGLPHTALAIFFFRGVALSDAVRQNYENYLAAKYFTKSSSYLVAVGDSITAGYPNNTANPWPLRLQAALGWSGYTNAAQSGMTAAQMVNAGAANIDTIRDDWYAHQPIVGIMGINDLSGGSTDVQVEGSITTWVNDRKASRFPTFLGTIMPASTVTGTAETYRQSVNAWIRAGSSGANYVVDLAADARLTDPTNATYYESDHVHPTSAGDDVIESLFLASFRAAGY